MNMEWHSWRNSQGSDVSWSKKKKKKMSPLSQPIPHPGTSWCKSCSMSTCATCGEDGGTDQRALLPGLLLGGDAWGDRSGDLAGLWDTGSGEEAVGRLSGEVLESTCSTGGGDCEEEGEGGEGGGGGGVTLGKRSLRKPGRNWSIRVQVTPHSFVESTAWRERGERGVSLKKQKKKRTKNKHIHL